MKRFTRNFKKLSVKQIRTYAAIIVFSTLSFNALASEKDEAVSFEEELALENWMTAPFESGDENIDVIHIENSLCVPMP